MLLEINSRPTVNFIDRRGLSFLFFFLLHSSRRSTLPLVCRCDMSASDRQSTIEKANAPTSVAKLHDSPVRSDGTFRLPDGFQRSVLGTRRLLPGARRLMWSLHFFFSPSFIQSRQQIKSIRICHTTYNFSD